MLPFARQVGSTPPSLSSSSRCRQLARTAYTLQQTVAGLQRLQPGGSWSSTSHQVKDKYENEDLIRFGLPEDVWFHVDALSSAHVYLRQKKGEKLDDIPPQLLLECATLVKANSIEGCKMKEVDVVYTRWRNLKKTKSMDAGQVGFHDETKVRKVKVEKSNAIVNALNRTKEERHPDLEVEQEARAAEYRAEQKALKREQERLEREERRKRDDEARMKSYTGLFREENMTSNVSVQSSADVSASVALEEDFMVGLRASVTV